MLSRGINAVQVAWTRYISRCPRPAARRGEGDGECCTDYRPRCACLSGVFAARCRWNRCGIMAVRPGISVSTDANLLHAVEGTGSLTLCPARRMAHDAAKPRSPVPLFQDGRESQNGRRGPERARPSTAPLLFSKKCFPTH